VEPGQTHFITEDGTPLHHRCWLPVGEPKAVLVLIHGLSEHTGRYEALGQQLSRAGYAVRGLDLRGHGLSGGDRIFIPSFAVYHDDVAAFLGRVRREHPGKPLFLFGHSMGGLVVALLATQRDLDLCGLILSAAAVRVSDGVAPTLRLFARLAGILAPRLRIVTLRSAKLSRDPRVAADFERDRLVYHGRMPNRTGAEILRASRRVQRRLESIRLPLLVLHGTGDEVTDPQGSRQLVERAASADKTLKLYDGLWHDLFHEPEKEQVTRDLIDWLEGRRTGC